MSFYRKRNLFEQKIKSSSAPPLSLVRKYRNKDNVIIDSNGKSLSSANDTKERQTSDYILQTRVSSRSQSTTSDKKKSFHHDQHDKINDTRTNHFTGIETIDNRLRNANNVTANNKSHGTSADDSLLKTNYNKSFGEVPDSVRSKTWSTSNMSLSKSTTSLDKLFSPKPLNIHLPSGYNKKPPTWKRKFGKYYNGIVPIDISTANQPVTIDNSNKLEVRRDLDDQKLILTTQEQRRPSNSFKKVDNMKSQPIDISEADVKDLEISTKDQKEASSKNNIPSTFIKLIISDYNEKNNTQKQIATTPWKPKQKYPLASTQSFNKPKSATLINVEQRNRNQIDNSKQNNPENESKTNKISNIGIREPQKFNFIQNSDQSKPTASQTFDNTTLENKELLNTNVHEEIIPVSRTKRKYIPPKISPPQPASTPTNLTSTPAPPPPPPPPPPISIDNEESIEPTLSNDEQVYTPRKQSMKNISRRDHPFKEELEKKLSNSSSFRDIPEAKNSFVLQSGSSSRSRSQNRSHENNNRHDVTKSQRNTFQSSTAGKSKYNTTNKPWKLEQSNSSQFSASIQKLQADNNMDKLIGRSGTVKQISMAKQKSTENNAFNYKMGDKMQIERDFEKGWTDLNDVKYKEAPEINMNITSSNDDYRKGSSAASSQDRRSRRKSRSQVEKKSSGYPRPDYD